MQVKIKYRKKSTCTPGRAYDLRWCQKCKWHRWHLHSWSWGKNQPSLQDRRLKNKPTGIRIDAVDAPVDCYFPFHFVLNPLVLVGHVTDTCEPQAFML